MKALVLFLLFLGGFGLFGRSLGFGEFRFRNLNQFLHQGVSGFDAFVLRHGDPSSFESGAQCSSFNSRVDTFESHCSQMTVKVPHSRYGPH